LKRGTHQTLEASSESCCLQKRLRALNIESINAYCDLLRSPEGEDEVGDLLDVISTNVADFFREANRRSDLATARSAASAA